MKEKINKMVKPMGEMVDKDYVDAKLEPLRVKMSEMEDDLCEVKTGIKDLTTDLKGILLWGLGIAITGVGALVYLILDKVL
jgi:hypothetical protein